MTMRVLDVELNPAHNDPGASTVREYLTLLLAELWEREESFDGKRPFGNSGWQYEITRPICDAGLAADDKAARKLVAEAIPTLI